MIKIFLKKYLNKKFLSLVGAIYVYVVYISSKKTFIIAEIGINHNGEKSKAIKLIESAKESGADFE